ncbi:unnamed protein product [Clonostachys byssicola]|uniref:Uncharacterized protein n=1 Tax=Clonostachys byssicola TaxID=160290 RepID=A0A9N9URF6_9HYPO|nr:unnamed protein product [Clonostachys byssicola]
MRLLAFTTAALAAFPFTLAGVSKEAYSRLTGVSQEVYDPNEFINSFERIHEELAVTPHRIPKLEDREIKDEKPAIAKIKKLTPARFDSVKQQKFDPTKLDRKLCPKCGKQDQHKPCDKPDPFKPCDKKDDPKPCYKKYDLKPCDKKEDDPKTCYKKYDLKPCDKKEDPLKPCHKKHDPKPCDKKQDHKIYYLNDPTDLGRKHGHDKNKHEIHYKHEHEKEKKHKDLTAKCICERLHHLAHKADHLFDFVKDIKCGNGDRECWEPVRKALYELEWKLDLFDRAIDKSSLDKCFSEEEEAHIARCYCRYAEALIRLLEEISRKLEHIEGRTAYFIVTAVNSLRAADYAFVYELGRRLQREKIQVEIFRKEGAADGSTPHSIRSAFARFVSTPYITGEDFRVEDYHKEPKEKELKIIEDIKNKFKHKGHHHPHHHKGHHHPHHHKDHHHHDKHCHHHRPDFKDHIHRIYHHKDNKDRDHHRHHHDHGRFCPHHKHHDHHRHHHKGHDDDSDKEKVRIKVEDHGDRAQ